MNPPASYLRALASAGALVFVLSAASSAADAQPDMTGQWKFNVKRSEDVRAGVIDSVGSDYTSGDAKKDSVRVWIRRWLLGAIENPDKQVLTIEQTAETFKSGTGDDVATYYFGREATSLGPGGGALKVTVRRQGDQVVTEEKAAKDNGRITAVYTLLPGGNTLLVAWRLEHKKLLKPLELKMTFDRMAE
jgi:hypothetical protein